MIVLDASIAVKLITQEPGSEAALNRVLAEDELIAPDWIKIEVASALSRKVRHGGLPLQAARAGMTALLAYLQDQLNSASLLEDAFALSVKIDHGIYDCLYLAAAVRHQCVALTADEPFVERATRGGFGAHV